MDINAIAQEFTRMANQSSLGDRIAFNRKSPQYFSWNLKESWQTAASQTCFIFKQEVSGIASYFNSTTSNQIHLDQKRIDNLLDSIAKLQVNWDGYGAVPPDNSVIVNARAFLDMMPVSLANELTENSIVPTPYGTLVFDWEKNANLISVEIGENEIGFFTDFEDKINFESKGISFNKKILPLELVNSFKKLFSSVVL